jgi:BirA family transcriptional regulator, biotin operon repressor / biotin---[acetyl-CoA-carboxylase] ligase
LTDLASSTKGFRLPVSAVESGWRVDHRRSVGSTNDEARAAALAGGGGRLWVVADEQTAGRGRRGRVWSSPTGNLYASALLIDPSPIARAAEVGFVTGLALHRAVSDLGGRDFALKWPNDLLWRGAKAAGILVEGVSVATGSFACIIGVGVNCTAAPGSAAYPTADLSTALGRRVSPDELFERFAFHFATALGEWRGGDGFASIRSAWLAVAGGVGEPIRITEPGGARDGVFEALDARGRLLLRREGRLEVIEAGDLTLLAGRDSATQSRGAAGA